MQYFNYLAKTPRGPCFLDKLSKGHHFVFYNILSNKFFLEIRLGWVKGYMSYSLTPSLLCIYASLSRCSEVYSSMEIQTWLRVSCVHCMGMPGWWVFVNKKLRSTLDETTCISSSVIHATTELLFSPTFLCVCSQTKLN